MLLIITAANIKWVLEFSEVPEPQILKEVGMQMLTHQHTERILMIGRNTGPLSPPVA